MGSITLLDRSSDRAPSPAVVLPISLYHRFLGRCRIRLRLRYQRSILVHGGSRFPSLTCRRGENLIKPTCGRKLSWHRQGTREGGCDCGDGKRKKEERNRRGRWKEGKKAVVGAPRDTGAERKRKSGGIGVYSNTFGVSWSLLAPLN